MSTPPGTKRSAGDWQDWNWRRIAFVAIAVYAILFLLLNDDRVGVSFVVFTAHTSLIFLILISMGLGAALALIGPALWRRRKQRGSGSGSRSGSEPAPPDERLLPPTDPQ